MESTELGAGPRQPERGMIERLAEQLGLSARAHHIYGPTVERDGITVVPVARVRYGFGGGGGSGRQGQERGEGNGAGAGVGMEPVGFIQIRDGQATFHAIRRPTEVARAAARTLVGAGLATWLVLSGIRALRGGRATVRRRPGGWIATRRWSGAA